MNQTTLNQQVALGTDAVGFDTSGNFIIAYSERNSGRGSQTNVAVERFAPDGTPMGGQVAVNQYTNGVQGSASLAVQPDGRFVVIWAGAGVGDSAGIFFRRFGADGTPLGNDQRVNVTTYGNQTEPTIAMGTDGRFAVAWSGRGTGDTSGVYFRSFSASGVPASGEIRVNQTTSGTQNRPDIAISTLGSIAVAWSGKGVGDAQGVFVQRFATDGSRIGDETRINTTTAGSQERPDLVFDEHGGVIIVWNGRGPGDRTGVFSRRWAPDSAIGTENQVNTGTAGVQQNAAIAAAGHGSYFVSWTGERLDRGQGKGWDILSQQIDVNGRPLLAQLVVNTTTSRVPSSASVGADRAGQLVVVWSRQGRGGSADVFARHFAGATDHARPFINVALTSDTGQSSSDRLTANPGVQGRVIDASAITSLRAGLDSTPVARFQKIVSALTANGRFTLSRARLEQIAGRPLTDGPHTLHLLATDTFANHSLLTDLSFVLDTAAPGLSAHLARDTGANPSDSITSDPTIAGRVVDRSRVTRLEASFAEANKPFAVITELVRADGRFAISPTRLDALFGGTLANGPHVLELRASDEHGHTSTISVRFTRQQDEPFITDLDLSTASDTSPAGDQSTSAGRVSLVGTAQPLATVKLVETGATALANREGRFQFLDVLLNLGANTLTVSTVNTGGGAAQKRITIERTEQSSEQDPVLRWNQAALEAVRLDASAPTVASRAFAMVQVAIYDAVAAIEHSQGFLVNLAAPAGASLEAAITGAGERVLDYLYPAQQSTFASTRSAALALVPDGAAENDGLAFGRAVADAVIALRSGDGWDGYVPISTGDAPGEWQFTPPVYDPFLTPQWATLEPFSMTSPDGFRPPGPPALTSTEFANAYNEVKSLGSATSTTRTADQTQIARFWADGAGTVTPAGHWNQIAEQIAQSSGNSVGQNARLFAMLNIAMADAAIAAWDAKSFYSFWRPVTAIRAGDTDGNDLTSPDTHWSPFLITPPFPEYISGHSTFSAAAATVLAAAFGDHTPFSIASPSLPGVTRSFDSFSAAAEEAGRSRIYGGIHYQFSNQDGLATGRKIGTHVLDAFAVSADATPPRIVIASPTDNLVTKSNIAIAGRVLDNLSGVQTLEAKLDGAAFVVVAFNALGQFSLPTHLALSGSADGIHVFQLRATDAKGNVSPIIEFKFTLDTEQPTILVNSPSADGSLQAGALLDGRANGTGSDLTQLAYTIDSGPSIPVLFSSTGDFSVPLDLSRLISGQHTLVMHARDAAGNVATANRTFQLAAPIPFTLTDHAPADGAVEVGTTFRPKITFSRPINPATLTDANYYATTPAGDKIPAKIVVSSDSTFAWLFFNNPLPGGARITVHVDGSTILAADGGQPLNADGDSVPGGLEEFSFTTVSLTPLLGTTLSGRVFDPGPDLKPMTFDDLRAGPDGTIFTADDVFLLPIVHAKVWIIGLEDQAVFTDAQGHFSFAAAPAGDIKLSIDGRTATNSPAGVYFPEMVMDQFLDAGRANTVMGTMGSLDDREAFRDRQEVYLPRIENTILRTVNGSQPLTIGVDARSAPNLSPEQRAVLSIEVQPGSLVDEHGNPLASGQVGISTVPPELVREMLPPGVLQHTFDITVQAPGITNFRTPAPMTFPNVFNAAPGTELNFLSFDHTTGRLVIEGTATVSPDGLSVHTDPGTGITHPGWHGLTPPGSNGGPESNDPTCPALPPETETQASAMVAADCGCGSSPTPLTATDSQGVSAAAEVPKFAFQKYLGKRRQDGTPAENLLMTTNDDAGVLYFKNLKSPDCSANDNDLVINVTVDNAHASQFLQGLKSISLALAPGKQYRLDFFSRRFVAGAADPLLNLSRFDSDRLYGVKVQIEIFEKRSGRFVSLSKASPFFVYRYVDAGDDASDDGLLRFPAAVSDGVGIAYRRRLVEYHGDPDAKPELRVSGTKDFGVASIIGPQPLTTLDFDPQQIGDSLKTDLHVLAPGGTEVRPMPGSTLALEGSGMGKTRVNVNLAQLKEALDLISRDVSPYTVTLEYDRLLPYQFQLQYGDAPPTGMIRVDTPSASAVQSALEALPGIGVGGVDVQFKNEVRVVPPNDPAQRFIVKHIYTITPKGSFAARATPFLKVIISPGATDFKPVVRRHGYEFGLITPNERSLIDAPAERDAFATAVFNQLAHNYAGFGRGIEFVDAGPAAFNIKWTTTGSAGRYGHAVEVRPLYQELTQFLGERDNFNPMQQEFRLAQIVNRNARKGQTVEVYPASIFSSFEIPFDASSAELVNLTQRTAAHELGHSLGLVHTASYEHIGGINEVQSLQLVGGDATSTFQLSFGGEPTATSLPRNATGLDVQQALRRLRGIGNDQHFLVQGPAGGPYTVLFADPQFAGISVLQYANVPQIIGSGTNGLQVVAGTTVDGEGFFQVNDNVVIKGSEGINDRMSAGLPLRAAGFQPHISHAGLRMALSVAYTTEDRDDYMTLLTRASNLDLVLSALWDPETGLPPAGEEEDLTIEGPRLAVLDADGVLVPGAIEFGTVSVGSGSTTRRLTLLNFGSEDAIVRNASITQGYDQFSVAQIPVTTLRPGETLELDVSFRPSFSVPARGVLSIGTDIPGFDGQFDLSGVGQPADEPEIQFHYYTNNLGGTEVGRLTSYANKPSISNQGKQPLTITAIRVAAGQGQNEYFVETNRPLPITLQPGESFEFNLLFQPSKSGLRPGAIEIVSNDSDTPVLRQPFIGTGVLTNDFVSYEGIDLGNDFIAVENTDPSGNSPALRTRSDDGGNWDLFLPAQSLMHIATFDPVSGLIATGVGMTNGAGQRTNFNIGAFVPSSADDSDGDGLPDDVEFAIGTSPSATDTDGDGQSDFAEIDGGQNPLDDRPSVSGIVSALATGGPAHDVLIATDFADPSKKLAYLAVGEAGIAIADVTNLARPMLVGQLDPADATSQNSGISSISLDVESKLLAAASPGGGVFLIDVADRANPRLLVTIPQSGTDAVASVELFDGHVFVAAGGEIRSFNASTGEPEGTFAFDNQLVLGMARRDYQLFVTLQDQAANQKALQILDITGAGLKPLGSLALPNTEAMGEPFVADKVLWIPALDRVITIAIDPLDKPRLIEGDEILDRTVNAIRLNGSGLGVIAGGIRQAGFALVLQTGDPRNVQQVFTRFTLPEIGEQVALSSGLAYVADGPSGVQIVNFLAYDQGQTPPTIVVDPISGDVDAGRAGLQMVEATTVVVPAQISDDTQVRSVELLVDGKVVRSELSYPYDLSTVLPKVADTGTDAVLQIRATDTGGNVRLSDPILIELVPDVTPPVLEAVEPPNGSTQPISLRRISQQFSEPLDRATAVTDNFILRGPSGEVIPLSLQLRQRDTRLELFYPPLAEGDYQLVTHAAAVTDRVGNPLGADDAVSTFHVGRVAHPATIRWVNEAGGLWDVATNWIDVATQTPRLPTVGDDVLIDVPTDALITIGGGTVEVNSIVSNERFAVTGGTLSVTETIQVNNTFVLRGTSFQNVATLSGSVLRGSGGQTLTIGGDSRLDGATIQTDVTISDADTRLRVKNGLALMGTATISATNVAIGFEGTQTITSGTFTTGQAAQSTAEMRLHAIGSATVTLGADVVISGAGILANTGSSAYGPGVLHVINYGTIAAGGGHLNLFYTRTESLENHGLIMNDSETGLDVGDRTWSNAADGRLLLNGDFSKYTNLIQVTLEGTSWSNAGTIELNNVSADVMRDSQTKSWSNTGTLILNDSVLALYGKFTSDDLRNVRQTNSVVQIVGQMDNTGRIFTITPETGSFTTGGRITGGTIVSTGPNSRLEFGGGTLDGVALVGDIVMGGVRVAINGDRYIETNSINVENGLTLDGTITMYDSGENAINFIGPQTLSGGNLRLLKDPDGTFDGSPFGFFPTVQALNGGPVVFDSNVTIHGGVGLIVGRIISQASITSDSDGFLRIEGSNTIKPTFAGPFVNRGVINAASGSILTLAGPFTNESTITAEQSTLRTRPFGNWHNNGTIDITNQGKLEIDITSTRPSMRTADFGNLLDSGGTVVLARDLLLDNSGSTLVIDGTADWTLGFGVVEGGTIRVADTAHLHGTGGLLKDVRLEGNLGFALGGSLSLVGDITIVGTISPESPNADVALAFGDRDRYRDVPTIIRSGTIEVRTLIDGTRSSGSVTLEPGVVLRGRSTQTTLSGAVLNRGLIEADATNPVASGELFAFTAAPVTNQGTLSAVNRAILRIANLAAPNGGTISAASGGTVNFTGPWVQAAAGQVAVTIGGTAAREFGHVTTAASAALDGTLNVSFAAGFTPKDGDRFDVLDYASHTGSFSAIHVANLPESLIVSPEYNSKNLILVVSAALHAAAAPANAPPSTLRAGDVPEAVLSAAIANGIKLDDDAPGFAWFFDPTADDGAESAERLTALGLRSGIEQTESHLELFAAVMNELSKKRPALHITRRVLSA